MEPLRNHCILSPAFLGPPSLPAQYPGAAPAPVPSLTAYLRLVLLSKSGALSPGNRGDIWQCVMYASHYSGVLHAAT